MNAELERDMKEAGDGLLQFAESLRRAPQAHVSSGFADRTMARIRRRAMLVRWLRPIPFAAAAAIAALLALAVVDGQLASPELQEASEARLVACQRADGSFTGSSASRYVQAFAVSAIASGEKPNFAALKPAVDALLRSQRADGGWGGEGLSARNVAALAAADAAGMKHVRSAYRRGLRYLRMHGMTEMSASEFSREAKDALARLGSSRDAGLVYSAELASRL